MEKLTRTLQGGDNEPTWSASGKKTVKIPLDRWVAEVMLRFTFTYDTAAAPTVVEDAVFKAVSKVTLWVNSKAWRSWAPRRYWYKLPLDLRVFPEKVDPTTSVANGKTASFVLTVPFRLDMLNEEDLSALLPALYLSSLELEIEWGAANAFGTNQTIQSGKCQVTLKERVLTQDEELTLYGTSGDAVAQGGSNLLAITEQEKTQTVGAVAANKQFEMDLPTGAILTRTFVFAVLNGARDDTLVTDYEVKDTRGSGYVYTDETWAASQARDLQEYGPPKAVDGNFYLKGFTVLDHVDYGALDLRGRRSGETKWRASVIAPVGTTEITHLHEMVVAANYASN